MVNSTSKEATQKAFGSWLVASYLPITLFSLRMSHATSSGGKSLFVPTPYAVKLALVDASFRAGGQELAYKIFDWVKGREIRFQPPKYLTVNHTFVKIKREPKKKKPEEPFIPSIGFREFCFFQGEMVVAINVQGLTQEIVETLQIALAHINYFGKRGSFFQFSGSQVLEILPEGFTIPDSSLNEPFNPGIYCIVQFLDDIGDVLGKDLFERINTYSKKSIELGKHRALKPYLLPYRMVESSKGYSFYINGI